jgi:transcriptional regulator GlxA family with amidase domain
MNIAIFTFDGFNELDSLVAFNLLNRIRRPGWRVSIASPGATVTSLNGLTIHAQCGLAEGCLADAVIIGSGSQTRQIAQNGDFMSRLKFDPGRQLIGAQCSGALLLARLGLLGAIPACTDHVTKPWALEGGIEVLDQPFHAQGNIATAGGCLASPYLAAWLIARLEGTAAAESALHYVAPVGEKEEYVSRAMEKIVSYLPPLHEHHASTFAPHSSASGDAAALVK